MKRVVGWFIAVCMAVTLVAVPYVYYRSQYSHAKRLRVVTDGKFYRSGQMTAAGLDEAIQRFGLRTIVNLQNEDPDPQLVGGPLESVFCRQRGVKYVFIGPDLLERKRVPHDHPEAIDAFLKVMDDPANHPVLLHCRAGLHRTGVLTAVYRMEYDGWTKARALAELKANGFGDSQATARNDYIMQYLLNYRARTPESGRRTAVASP